MTKQKVNIEKEIETTLFELLKKMEVEASIKVTRESEKSTAVKEKEDHYRVNVETPETGLLIGFHGETINSLQLLLGVILYKKLGKWLRVILDVGNYRDMRDETIKQMVERIVKEVEETGKGVELSYLSPLERRKVHLMLSENKKVVSQSSGEGKYRRLTIKPR